MVLIPNNNTVPAAHAAAGLSHCCALSEEILAAHKRGAEVVGRILARSLFETWLIAYYIHLGGIEALEAVAAAYRDALETQRVSLEQNDSAVRARRRDVRQRNRRIAETNRGIELWNKSNPGSPPKAAIDLLPQPPGVIVGLEPQEWDRNVPNVPARRLPLTTVIDRLRALTRAAGQEEVFDASYHLAYRGLSLFGAHANLFVLNGYLNDRGGKGIFLRVQQTASVPSSFAEPNIAMSLLLTAGLAAAVLGDRGADCEKACAAVARINASYSPREDA